MSGEIKKLHKNESGREDPVIVPAADIYETANEYVIKADMPGVGKENLEVTIEKNELHISGTFEDAGGEHLRSAEYRPCNYRRAFTVGDAIDRDKIQAALENGVLTLTLPKSEAVKPRRIEIKVA